MKSIAESIAEDELFLVTKAFRKRARVAHTRAHWTNRSWEKRLFNEYVVIGGGFHPARLTVLALSRLSEEENQLPVSVCDLGMDLDRSTMPESGKFRFVAPEEIKPVRSGLLLFADCADTGASAKWLAAAETVLRAAGRDENSFCVVCAAVPDPPVLPGGLTHLAEREYDICLERKPDKKPEDLFFLAIRDLCRKAVQSFGAKVTFLRAAHVYGPGVRSEPAPSVKDMIQSAFSEGAVHLGDTDFSELRSYTYTADAALAAFWALQNTTPGNEFNIRSFSRTQAQLKWLLRCLFPERLAVSCQAAPGRDSARYGLSNRKFGKTSFRRMLPLGETLSRTACFLQGHPYPDNANETIYDGKLARIKQLELRMLAEVDRICEKHGLRYFIAAGSLLGAKRYGHNIPWDDDLDIAFLRPDFDKFRKVAESELPPDMEYCNWFNGAESHYPVDKIRIRDTWFSTNYSAINRIPDGVFLDILVYDATSDIPFVAWIHNKIMGVFQFFLLQILWRKPHRKQFRNLFTWLVYKALCIFPISFYHWWYERILTIFRFKKRPKQVIDGLGARAGLKTIPAAGLFETKRIPFDDGTTVPAPADPEDYLVFAYGPDYMREPPLSQQKGHRLARIDLGHWAFGDAREAALPRVDPRGELFERPADTSPSPPSV